MALTIVDAATSGTEVRKERVGSKYEIDLKCTGDSSYPTGGWSLPKAKFGMSRVDVVHISQVAGYVLSYDYTNEKVQAHYQTDPGAAAAGTNIPLVEVANATNLSTLVFRVSVKGI